MIHNAPIILQSCALGPECCGSCSVSVYSVERHLSFPLFKGLARKADLLMRIEALEQKCLDSCSLETQRGMEICRLQPWRQSH